MKKLDKALHNAGSNCNLDAICKFLRSGAKVNAQNIIGRMRLHEASFFGSAEAVKL